jgi:hypothetical protein
MSGILSSQYGIFLAEIESAYGTDAVDAAITANDDIAYRTVMADSAIQNDSSFYRPDTLRPGQDGVKHARVSTSTSGTIRFPMRAGIGTPNTPACGIWLKCAGFTETVGSSDTAYVQSTNVDTSVSVHEYRRNLNNANWRLIRLLGGIGSAFGFQATVGEEVMGEIQLLGNNDDEMTVDRAYFDADGDPALDYDGSAYTYTGSASAEDTTPFICKSITATFNGVTYPLSAITYASNLEGNPINTLNGATTNARSARGRGGTNNSGGNLALETNDLAAALDAALTAYQAGTEAALSVVVGDGTNQFTVSMPKAQLTQPSRRATGAAMGFDLGYVVNGDWATSPLGDNGVTITWDDV